MGVFPRSDDANSAAAQAIAAIAESARGTTVRRLPANSVVPFIGERTFRAGICQERGELAKQIPRERPNQCNPAPQCKSLPLLARAL
jgi:hypothetical protein